MHVNRKREERLRERCAALLPIADLLLAAAALPGGVAAAATARGALAARFDGVHGGGVLLGLAAALAVVAGTRGAGTTVIRFGGHLRLLGSEVGDGCIVAMRRQTDLNGTADLVE